MASLSIFANQVGSQNLWLGKMSNGNTSEIRYVSLMLQPALLGLMATTVRVYAIRAVRALRVTL